ncbi:unnamed protein product [Ostreobium quekettii]|uniref:RNA-dependent RNA polymerase n=1 Tax=Ostreobium quekettii TaxID=121088 RepID=A0A8S1JAQ0_9CHLO|nr:unnamed protein product [Ostreobium quekettii]|eukprot:evm.model.scf_108.2 EVM.evm.TU.scf_108.2   scf_108:3600-7960(-)
MDYTASPKAELDRPVTIDDVIAHICEYIMHDNLGIIDTMHLALADMEGVDSKDCLTLAEQHSKAVDAPKSGDWQSVDRDIQAKVKKYPDFMMKTRKPRYPSDKVLGKMFRECHKYVGITKPVQSDQDVRAHSGFIVKGYEAFEEEAKVARTQYNNDLHHTMKMYGIRTEEELMSGHIETLHEKVHDKEVDDVRETVKLIRRKLIETFRNRFEEGLGKDEEKRLQKASAWYLVTYGDDPTLCVETYDPEQDPRRRGEIGGKNRKAGPRRFLSFPWVVSDVLAKVYYSNMKNNPQGSMLSIATIIGMSVIHKFEETGFSLIDNWSERCGVLKTVKERLAPIGYTFMTGLSASMLFDEKGKIEFVLVPSREGDRNSAERDLKLQRRIMDGAHDLLYVELEKTKRPPGDPKHAMLLCKLAKPLTKVASGTWAEITVLTSALKKWSTVVMYMKQYPYLLPLLRLLAGWVKGTGLTDPGRGLVDSCVVPFMFLNMCLNDGEFPILSTAEVEEVCEMVACGRDVCLFADLEGWQRVVKAALGMDAQRKGSLGDLLLEFFRHGRRHIDDPIQPCFRGVLFKEGSPSFGQLMGDRAAHLLLEEMDRACHRLSLRADASALLTVDRLEQLHYIETNAAYSILGAESGFGKFLRRRSGATEIEVFPRTDPKAPGLLIRAVGTAAAHWSVGRIVRNLGGQYANDEKNTALYTRASSATEGAYCYLMEGAESQGDRIVLEDYHRPCHPYHDRAAKSVARMCTTVDLAPLSGALDSNFAAFMEHFLKQLGRMDRLYAPQMHGDCDLRVQFGKSYIRGALWELGEDGLCTVGMLRQALEKRKKGEVHPAWVEAAKTRRACTRRHVNTRDLKYREVGNSASFSFFPQINRASRSGVEEWVRGKGLIGRDAEEAYELLVTRDGVEDVACYDERLNLRHVAAPDLRWAVVDVKRAFLRKPPARGGVDGAECDIRFILRTQFPPDHDIRQAAATGLHGALSWAAAGQSPAGTQMPRVGRELMEAGQALSLRHERRRIFKSCRAGGGLSNVQVELTECGVLSRPAYGRFSHADNYLNVQLRPLAECLRTGESASVGSFLEDVWRLAFELSNVIQGQPA